MQPQSETEPRVAVLDDAGFAWAERVVWALCIGIYLTVFIGGILAGGGELISVGRAAAFTLLAAVLGKIALNFLGTASLPGEPGPMATPEGKLGSLGDLVFPANVPLHQDEAEAASRER